MTNSEVAHEKIRKWAKRHNSDTNYTSKLFIKAWYSVELETYLKECGLLEDFEDWENSESHENDETK